MQKNLQYLGFAFPDAEYFGAWNAKFFLYLAFAFSSADALRKQDSGKSSLCVNQNLRVVEIEIDAKVVCDLG